MFPITEDSVIEHDARYVPGYDFIDSDLTGRAVFKKHGEQLEVFTANRRPLEHVMGVDLIYLNVTRENMVMLQYKMLEPRRIESETDWIYRPDGQLDDEIRRMRKFAAGSPPAADEYRLNPSFFYLKFVKRDAALGAGSIITPLEHFEVLSEDPDARGPRGGPESALRAPRPLGRARRDRSLLRADGRMAPRGRRCAGPGAARRPLPRRRDPRSRR